MNGLHLTKQQKEVIHGLSHGYPVRDIAEQLNVTVRTVERRISEAREKFGVSTKTHLVAVTLRQKIIE